MENFNTVTELVNQLRPTEPVHCIRPHVVKTAATWFLNNFPGHVIYAVKSNPDPRVLTYLYEAGIRRFDVASLREIELVHGLFPDAQLHFMHPVKNRDSIAKAYFDYGVRHYSLDSATELKKLLEATNNATDLGIHIRIAMPANNGDAAMDLSGKFGVNHMAAVKLLQLARKSAKTLGICFHVGSQCMNPSAYGFAMKMAKGIIKRAKVKLDVLDIGGGFPSIYPGMTPPALDEYMSTIRKSFACVNLEGCELWCEPGRALVAEAGSLLVKVELRKNRTLYINDGIYGTLFDAGFPGFIYPTRTFGHDGKPASKKLVPFRLYGPTCDSMDVMNGPFMLPNDIQEGDWIEIGQLGAYGHTLQSRFNGFYSDTVVEVADSPMLSMFGFAEMPVAKPAIVKPVAKAASAKQPVKSAVAARPKVLVTA